MNPRMYPGTEPDQRTSFPPYSAFDIPADLRVLHGRYDVEAMGRRMRNFRYAEEWTMMILGGWIATMPELPVKTGLGKIIWETAQAADELGRRLPELRCGRRSVHASESSNEGFAELIQTIAAPDSPALTIEKLVGVFDVLKPHLIAVYEITIEHTDPISDAPTIKILEEIVARARRHVTWGDVVLGGLCDASPKVKRRQARVVELGAQLANCGGVTGDLPAAADPTDDEPKREDSR